MFIYCNRSERVMSREGHWKAEDYTWDPHSLRVEARSSAAAQQEQPGSARKSPDEGLCFLSVQLHHGQHWEGWQLAIMPAPLASSPQAATSRLDLERTRCGIFDGLRNISCRERGHTRRTTATSQRRLAPPPVGPTDFSRRGLR